MSYTFTGQFWLSSQLYPEEQAYLHAFSTDRHVKRDVTKIDPDDPVRLAVGLDMGIEGAYCVNRNNGASLLDTNNPPAGMPEVYCDFIPNDEGTALIWDETENMRYPYAWLCYLRDHFFIPWGYTLDGQIAWKNTIVKDDYGVLYCHKNALYQGIGAETSVSPKRPGYGQPGYKRPQLAYTEDAYALILEIYQVFSHRKKTLATYRSKIDGVTREEFYTITREYVELVEL